MLCTVNHVLIAKDGRSAGEARAAESEGKAQDRPNLHSARPWQRLSRVVKRQVANREERVSQRNMQRMGLMGPMGLPEFIVVLVLVNSGEFGDIFIRKLRLAVTLRAG